MAYRCTKYDKILVGLKKTCESCEIGDLESECEYRIWQEGVLKVRKVKKRRYMGKASSKTAEPLPMVVGLDVSDLTKSDKTYLRYMLGLDEKYHYFSPIPENLNTQEISILEVLAKEDIEFARKKNWSYHELLKQKGIC